MVHCLDSARSASSQLAWLARQRGTHHHAKTCRAHRALRATAERTELPFFPDRRLVEPVALPSLRDCKHFVNLTNGIEALPRLNRVRLPYTFVRVQSTACEQQLFEKLVAELDSELLLQLALGHCCLVYDFGSRNKKRGAPRAIWYGLEFLRFVLERAWLGAAAPAAGSAAPVSAVPPRRPPYLRGVRMSGTFERYARDLSKQAKRRLHYFARFLPPGGLPAGVRLFGAYAATHRDEDLAFYRSALHREVLPRSAALHSSGAGGGGGPWRPGGLYAGPPLPPPAEVESLLAGDPHAAAERLLGMRLFLGGISNGEYDAWRRDSGLEGAGFAAEAAFFEDST